MAFPAGTAGAAGGLLTLPSSSSSSSTSSSSALIPASSSSLTSSSSTPTVSSSLLPLVRRGSNYSRNRAHLCSFFARGECNRGTLCPFRHEMPPEKGPLSKQKIQDRYHGVNDPVADKILQRAKERKEKEDKPLVVPSDPTITTLWLGFGNASGGGAVRNASVSEEDLHEAMSVYGQVKSIKVVADKGCAFVSYVTRQDAEQAADGAHNRLVVNGVRIRVNWAQGKPKTSSSSSGVSNSNDKRETENSDSASGNNSSSLPPPPGMLSFPSLPPPPGMNVNIRYPSQDPSQGAVKLG